VGNTVRGDYQPPLELAKLMKRFKPDPPINHSYGLRRCDPLPIGDSNLNFNFEFCRGTFAHVFALNKIFQNRFDGAACEGFRRAYENSWIRYPENKPMEGTRLFHNANAEVVVFTSDGKIVLGKRPAAPIVAFYPGAWSVSIEDQKLRKDARGKKSPDLHIFDAADRGVREELGVTPIPNRTRLLQTGVEWGNFTAAFLFAVHVKETFRQLVDKWLVVKHDPNEAVALDCIDATPKAIKATMAKTGHTPSSNWEPRVVVESPASGWHPTAIARLHAALQYVEQE
jgi:hypothetical protein